MIVSCFDHDSGASGSYSYRSWGDRDGVREHVSGAKFTDLFFLGAQLVRWERSPVFRPSTASDPLNRTDQAVTERDLCGSKQPQWHCRLPPFSLLLSYTALARGVA